MANAMKMLVLENTWCQGDWNSFCKQWLVLLLLVLENEEKGVWCGLHCFWQDRFVFSRPLLFLTCLWPVREPYGRKRTDSRYLGNDSFLTHLARCVKSSSWVVQISPLGQKLPNIYIDFPPPSRESCEVGGWVRDSSDWEEGKWWGCPHPPLIT